jgi:hypothetical protein
MNTTRQILVREVNKLALTKRLNSSSTASVCPHLVEETADDDRFLNAKPYSQVPGPKPIPILGNTWR